MLGSFSWRFACFHKYMPALGGPPWGPTELKAPSPTLDKGVKFRLGSVVHYFTSLQLLY